MNVAVSYLSRINWLLDPPLQEFEENTRIVSGGSTASKSPIGSGPQDAGHKGVATGCCEFSLCSSNNQWGMKKTPTD